MNDLHILIVDDHALVREGLKARLLAEPGVVRVTEAADAGEALKWLDDGPPPALMLTDISMRGMTGIALMQQVRERHPTLPVIVLSMYEHREYVIAAVRAGARGYVLKDSAAAEIRDAVQAIFGVTVVKVNTLNRKGKRKRNRRSPTFGRRPDTKRALVTLAEGDSIDLFEG